MHWIFIFLLETLEHIFSFIFHMEFQNLKAEYCEGIGHKIRLYNSVELTML